MMSDAETAMNARRVVEEMSFQRGAPQVAASSGYVAAPPAAPPPPPPPSDSDVESVRSVTLDNDSHHRDTISNNFYGQTSQYYGATNNNNEYNNDNERTSRAAPIPIITNYGLSNTPPSSKPKVEETMGSRLRGDATLRPNTGQTNDDFGGIGSLREVASRLRWLTIICTALAIVWEGFAFPTRLIFHVWDEPAKVVLGAYLAVFCILLLGVELNAPLRENFGVLYHPLGRSTLLFLMTGMCFGILAEWWETLLGLGFFICAIGYLVAYIKYPEYRRWEDYKDNKIWQDVKAAISSRTSDYAWAQTSARNLSTSWQVAQDETQSLLHNV